MVLPVQEAPQGWGRGLVAHRAALRILVAVYTEIIVELLAGMHHDALALGALGIDLAAVDGQALVLEPVF